jgi:hypothetical protein
LFNLVSGDRIMWPSRAMLIPAIIAAGAFATPAIAQMGPWGGWGRPSLSDHRYSHGRSSDPRQGKVEVSRYIANSPNVAKLGHGPIAVAAAPGSMSMGSESAAYEAAIVDQLVKSGYQTQGGAQAAAEPGAQVAEIVIRHDVVEPAELPRSPVSGAANLGVGTYGTSVGVAIAIDMTKPAKALISTRLDASIRDKATNELLWEGHAKVLTRVGDDDWTTQKTAARLAAALFEGFPNSATAVGSVEPATGRR